MIFKNDYMETMVFCYEICFKENCLKNIKKTLFMKPICFMKNKS